MNKYKIIAIDGPSSSGKGTIAKIVAQKLGFSYLDSGSIYRALALLVLRYGYTENDLEKILDLIKHELSLTFKNDGLYLNDENIEFAIRDEKVGMWASNLGKNAEIRNNLLSYQKKFAECDNLVTDGRDMGSVVFPQAILKIFLSASAQKRAERRFNQLQLLGKSVKIQSILQDIVTRDKQDSDRSVAPLVFNNTYKMLDNTELSIEECVDQIISWYQELLISIHPF